MATLPDQTRPKIPTLPPGLPGLNPIGPVQFRWTRNQPDSATSPAFLWWVDFLETRERPVPFGELGVSWFNTDAFSGVEHFDWSARISNTDRRAAVWGVTREVAIRDAMSVVLPAALRRDGIFDGHGTVIAPDPSRPDAGVFVTGLSGAGKSTLTASCAVAGSRILSDDSVAIGRHADRLTAWSRRPGMGLSAEMHRRLLPDVPVRAVEDKLFFNARRVFGDQKAESLEVKALVFLERGQARTEVGPLSASDAFGRLLMGHPALAIDALGKRCFDVVRDLSRLPVHRMSGGKDLIEPKTAAATLARILPD